MRAKSLKPELTYYDIAEGVTAFSSTRHGGYSEGPHGEFNVNLYCGDDPDTIAANRKALCKLLRIKDDRLVMPHQVHTNIPGVCIGVSTADCIPIILYDPEHRAASVVHSGWRGTVANIAGVAVTSMQRAYHTRPEVLKAVIGPGISLENFEVGDEVYDQFAAAGYPMAEIARRYEKWHIDLWQCCRLQLEAVGLKPEHIEVAGICTYDRCDDYFSARRLGIESGRILTAIMIRESK